MVKNKDPLQYYTLKTKLKLSQHNESTRKLKQLTQGKKKEGNYDDEEEEGGLKEDGEKGGQGFRNKMFEMLQKTNQRVQLDRPFLIREKMQVIMLDSEKNSPKSNQNNA